MKKLEREAQEFMEKRRKEKIKCPKCETEMYKFSQHILSNDYTFYKYTCNNCDTFLIVYMK